MASQQGFSSVVLGVLPELDAKKDPLLFNEFVRLRGAIRSIAETLDNYMGINSTSSSNFAAGRIPYGAGSGWSTSAAFTYGSNKLTVPSFGTLSLFSDSTQLGFYAKSATPGVQPTTLISAAAFVAGVGTTVNSNSTFDGYTIGQVITALRTLGLLA